MSFPEKILITGGTGFVGRNLQDMLNERGIAFKAFGSAECDLTDRGQTEAFFEEHRDADVIVHLASFQAAGDFPAKNPGLQFYVNNLIHLNVLEGWRKFLPHAKLFANGTSCAYPSGGPLIEDRFMDGAIHGSVYAYAFTKRLLYRGITAYNDQYGLNGSYLVPPTLFGKYDDFHVDTAHVSGALIAKFVRAAREHLPEVEVWGDGTQVREFLYVRDYLDALLKLIPVCDRDLVNVGPGRGTRVRELATAIRDAVGYEGRLFFNADRYTGVQEKYMNAEKLQLKYDIHLKTDLRDAVRLTVEWYVAHYDELKDKPKFAALRQTA